MFPFYLFSPWTETFHNNMIRRSVLKNKGSIFIYFIPFCCLIFCGDFWDKLTAVLKVTMFCHARAFFVWFFFSLVFILLWTGKRCDICLIPMRFPFYLFFPWTEKRCDFRNNMIHMAVLKNKFSIFIYFIRFFSQIFCGNFWDRLTAVLKATTLCWICSLFLRIFVIFFSGNSSFLED